MDEKSGSVQRSLNDMYCDMVSGQREIKHYYQYGNKRSYVLVDCETQDLVIEGGLDKRSSLDSIQQALFFAYLTGKKPVIVIYDTDGTFGKYEYRIQQAARIAGIEFKIISIND